MTAPADETGVPAAGRGDTDDSGEACPRIDSLDWSNEHGFTRVVLEVAPGQLVPFDAARPAEPPGELREAILSFFCTRYQLSIPTEVTDALLSGPLAPLLAAQATVKRVEALLAEEPNIQPLWEFERGALRGIEMTKAAIRRALDGPH